ncbi:hypothetical protein GA0115239_100290 [Streptomyces sp. BpilaLS-43]|nr:hypothetical protein GA0115239_100290 [Streptomyces sp. BpilaLS-43]
MQGGGQFGEVSGGLAFQTERGEHLRLGGRPPGPGQQLGARIAPAVTVPGEYVPSAQRAVQVLQDAERVRGFVDHAVRQAGVGEHQPPPRAGHQVGGDLLGADLLAADQFRQSFECLHDRGAGLDRAEVDDLDQQADETAHRAVPGDQFGPPLRVVVPVGVRDRRGDRGERLGQLLAWHDLLDRRPRVDHGDEFAGVGRGRGRHQHVDRRGDLLRCLPQLGQGLELGVVAHPLGLREQLGGHQRVQQIERVVHRRRLQMPHRRQQRGGLPGDLQPLQRRRLRGQPVPGQPGHPRGRDPSGVHRAGAQAPDLTRTVQGEFHGPARHAHRAQPQPFQLRHPLLLRYFEQPDHLGAQVVRDRLVQRGMQPVVLLRPYGGHHPGQRRDPGQQHPVVHQPHHRPVEQGTRPLQRRPHSRRQELLQLRLTCGEVPVAVLVADLPRMFVHRLRARPVLGEMLAAAAELFGDEPHHGGWHHGGVLSQEGPEHPYRWALTEPRAQLVGRIRPALMAGDGSAGRCPRAHRSRAPARSVSRLGPRAGRTPRSPGGPAHPGRRTSPWVAPGGPSASAPGCAPTSPPYGRS